MSKEHSTTFLLPGKPTKPSKPYRAFPLMLHPSGQWCKKIRGKLYYFGTRDDPDGALAKYLEQKDALHAGRTPRPDTEGTTVKDAVNAFLIAKKRLSRGASFRREPGRTTRRQAMKPLPRSARVGLWRTC